MQFLSGYKTLIGVIGLMAVGLTMVLTGQEKEGMELIFGALTAGGAAHKIGKLGEALKERGTPPAG